MSGSHEQGFVRVGRLTIALTALALVAVVAVSQRQRGGGESPVEVVQSSHQLPASADVEALLDGGESGAPPLEAMQLFENSPMAASVGTIRLDLEYGNFRIVPGSPGAGVEITGTYEPDAFALEERYVDGGGDGAWLYHVTFSAKGGTMGMVFSGAGNQPQNDLTIALPPDVLFKLEGEWGIGELEAELGGLWLHSVDLQTRTGAHRLDFTTPTQWPLKRLAITKGVGEFAIGQLGNASAQVTRVQQLIGSARIDLGGAWLNDGAVEVRSRVGELRVDAPAPDQAHLQVEQTRVWVGEDVIDAAAQTLQPSLGAPTITLRARLSVGELRVSSPRAPETPEAEEGEITEDTDAEFL